MYGLRIQVSRCDENIHGYHDGMVTVNKYCSILVYNQIWLYYTIQAAIFSYKLSSTSSILNTLFLSSVMKTHPKGH